jgi:hypothetical protein
MNQEAHTTIKQALKGNRDEATTQRDRLAQLEDRVKEYETRLAAISNRHRSVAGPDGIGAMCYECGFIDPCWTKRTVDGLITHADRS